MAILHGKGATLASGAMITSKIQVLQVPDYILKEDPFLGSAINHSRQKIIGYLKISSTTSPGAIRHGKTS